jgi:hypothetical protein
VIAPAMATLLQVDPALIGFQVSFVYGGAMLAVIYGGRLVQRYGAARTQQICVGVAAVGALLATVPSLWLLPIAIDPDYYSADEAALVTGAKLSDEERADLQGTLRANAIPLFHGAGKTEEGFVIQEHERGRLSDADYDRAILALIKAGIGECRCHAQFALTNDNRNCDTIERNELDLHLVRCRFFSHGIGLWDGAKQHVHAIFTVWQAFCCIQPDTYRLRLVGKQGHPTRRIADEAKRSFFCFLSTDGYHYNC